MRVVRRSSIRRAVGRLTARTVLRRVEHHRNAVRAYGVRRLGLFGSAVRGQARSASDLDFIVEFERDTFDNYMGLKIYLEDLFHRKIDLVIADSVKERLRPMIMREVKYVEGF